VLGVTLNFFSTEPGDEDELLEETGYLDEDDEDGILFA